MAVAFGDLRPTHLQCAVEDGIGWIRLNRPPVNAIDLGLLEELVQAVEAARLDPGVRAVMLASQIPGYFSAGLDLKELEHSADEGRAGLIDRLFKDGLIHAMRTARKVFVTVIVGHCLGGGLELALASDFRIGGEGKWQIGLPEVRLGGMPGGGGIQLLSRLIGQSRTLRLTLLGETIAPDRALEYGILDALYPEDAVLGEARAFVRRFADGPPHAIGAIKLALYQGQEIPLAHALVLERQLYRAINMGEDLQEGIRAFREKRPPRFTGR
jgi:enoyl-CoA hydratase/carnithine racemase